jgi:hypothetical protein
LQTDANFVGYIVSEMNAGVLKSFLNFENGGEVSFHDPFILFDALKRRQPNTSGASKFALTPTQERPRCANLRRISHPFYVDSIRYALTTPLL